MQPETLIKRLHKKYGEALHTLYLDTAQFEPFPTFDLQTITAISLSLLVVDPDYRCRGIGTAVMTDICAYADKYQHLLVLHPGFHTTKPYSRLVKFYTKFSFVKARGYDNKITGMMMYRAPKAL